MRGGDTVHTSYQKGTTLFLIFKDGRTAVDKFVDHKSGVVILQKLGRVKIADVRYMGVNRLDRNAGADAGKGPPGPPGRAIRIWYLHGSFSFVS